MTFKEKFITTLYIATSVAVLAHSVTEITCLIKQERRERKAMEKHIEANPLSI